MVGLFTVHAFPSVLYYIKLLEFDEICLETQDHYQKQTYRNRYYLYGANGRLRMNIPVEHNNSSRYYRDTKISYAVDWRKLHFKSMIAAYRSSPYFEYYEDDIAPIFKKKIVFLLDFNLEAFELTNKLLTIDLPVTQTTHYSKKQEVKDYRNTFNAKKDCQQKMEPYTQVFSDREGFIKDLSVLDLLFCEGTHALTYLKRQTTIV